MTHATAPTNANQGAPARGDGAGMLAEGEPLAQRRLGAMPAHGPESAAPQLAAALTMPRFLLLAALIAIGAMAARYAADTDTWWHLATGRWIVAHGTIPAHDIFSYTQAGTDWRIPGWPAQLLLYAVYSLVGDLGLSALAGLTVAATFAIVSAAAPGEQPFVRVIALIFAAVVSSIYWAARPALFSVLFAALYLWLLREPARRRTRLLVPALMTLWANTHGGFAIGFILIGLALAGHGLRWLLARAEADRSAVLSLTGIGLLSALAAMLNPYGPEMLAYPFKTVGLAALGPYIQEWQPPDLAAPLGRAFLFWVVGTGAVAAFTWRRVDLPAVAIFAGATALAFSAARHVPLSALAGVPVFATGLAALLERWFGARAMALGTRPGSPALNTALLVAVGALAVVRWLASSSPAALPFDSAMRPPSAAVAAMRAEPLSGPIFNSYDFGGYLIWALPEQPTFIDGRTDLYPTALFQDYVIIENGGPTALEALGRYGVRTALVRSGSPVSAALASSAAWRRVFSDDVAAVFTLR